jgi:hypothetical protein
VNVAEAYKKNFSGIERRTKTPNNASGTSRRPPNRSCREGRDANDALGIEDKAEEAAWYATGDARGEPDSSLETARNAAEDA